MDFRAVLPERVLGKASTELTNLKAATGPTSSLTRRMASLLISSTDFLLAAKRERKKLGRRSCRQVDCEATFSRDVQS